MATVEQGPAQGLLQVVKVQAHVIVDDRGSMFDYRLSPGDGPSQEFVRGDRLIQIPHSQELFELVFHLIDRDSSRKLVFDPAMPICAQDGSSCPTSGGIQTKQFEQEGPPQPKKLTVTNFNSAAGPVCFSLFFRDEKSGESVDPFDPIVDNGGGGGPSRSR
jgi:hypothetical protein